MSNWVGARWRGADNMVTLESGGGGRGDNNSRAGKESSVMVALNTPD